MSVPPDIMAALQGGAPAPAADSLPPDIMAALGAGAGEPAPEGSLHAGGAAEGDPEEHYREALDHLELGMKADVDEQRINVVLQCFTKIQGELAGSQKGMDGMMAGKFDPAAMRRMGAAEQSY